MLSKWKRRYFRLAEKYREERKYNQALLLRLKEQKKELDRCITTLENVVQKIEKNEEPEIDREQKEIPVKSERERILEGYDSLEKGRGVLQCVEALRGTGVFREVKVYTDDDYTVFAVLPDIVCIEDNLMWYDVEYEPEGLSEEDFEHKYRKILRATSHNHKPLNIIVPNTSVENKILTRIKQFVKENKVLMEGKSIRLTTIRSIEGDPREDWCWRYIFNEDNLSKKP